MDRTYTLNHGKGHPRKQIKRGTCPTCAKKVVDPWKAIGYLSDPQRLTMRGIFQARSFLQK